MALSSYVCYSALCSVGGLAALGTGHGCDPYRLVRMLMTEGFPRYASSRCGPSGHTLTRSVTWSAPAAGVPAGGAGGGTDARGRQRVRAWGTQGRRRPCRDRGLTLWMTAAAGC